MLNKIRGLLFSPKKTFTEIKDEEGFAAPLKFLILLCFIPSFLLNFFLLYYSNSFAFSTLMIHFVSIVATFLLNLIVMHFFISLLGGKEFLNTFKAISYPFILYPLFLVVSTIITVTFPSIILLNTLFLLIIGLYMLQLELWAFEILQNISQWKSFFAMFLSLIISSGILSLIGL